MAIICLPSNKCLNAILIEKLFICKKFLFPFRPQKYALELNYLHEKYPLKNGVELLNRKEKIFKRYSMLSTIDAFVLSLKFQVPSKTYNGFES